MVMLVLASLVAQLTGPVGPQPTITCPPSAIRVSLSASIQAVVDASPADTTFCLAAGIHSIQSVVTPKSGDVFVGEYGAVLDGTGWISTDVDAAAFRAMNVGVVGVTIRNLTIRNMPKNGIQVYQSNRLSTRWLIEFNDIGYNGRLGVNLGVDGIAQRNRLHHNGVGAIGGNYAAFQGDNAQFLYNEIAYGAEEQRVQDGKNYVFRGNWVHHNSSSGGIYYDGGFAGALVEDNTVEDNLHSGIFLEMQPYDGTPDTASSNSVRGNIVRNNTDAGIHLSHSHYVQIYSNQVLDNAFGVNLYAACDRDDEAPFTGGHSDLRHVDVADNFIRVPPRGGAYATVLSAHASCSTDYVAGLRDLIYRRNGYSLPSADGAYFLWDWSAPAKNLAQWQAMGFDLFDLFKLLTTAPLGILKGRVLR